MKPTVKVKTVGIEAMEQDKWKAELPKVAEKRSREVVRFFFEFFQPQAIHRHFLLTFV